MAHGVVPVISRFPGQRVERQFIDGETALTFPIGDIEAAAACIARLEADPGLWRDLSTRASASQQGRYGFEGSMDAWAAALDACLQRPASVGPIPRIQQRTGGRLQRLGLSQAWQDRMRDLLGRSVRHADPGSEWPTHSGRTGDEARREIAAAAARIDARPAWHVGDRA
jgi:hypothetical protein